MSVEPKGMYVVKKGEQYLAYGSVYFNIMWGVDYEITYTTSPRLVIGFKDEKQAQAIAYLIEGKVIVWGDDK